MAASDKPFNNQRTLDIVFGVSNILLLLSVVWMFVQDYSREYKTEQRIFRMVEVAIAQRQALENIPSEAEFSKAEALVKDLKQKRNDNMSTVTEAQAVLTRLQPKKERAEANFQAVKADVESFTSLLNIAVEHGDMAKKKHYEDLLVDRNKKMAEAQAARDDIENQMKAERMKIDAVEGDYIKAVAAFKKINDKLDAQVKLAQSRTWGMSERFRTLPVINGFADPLKIHQFTINDIPIDYNFKQVTRFDRCMSCHQGIDRPAFSRENLLALTKEDANKAKLDEAIAMYKRRMDALDPKDRDVIPNPGDLSLVKIDDKTLTPARITEFCAHPRLDLYVGSNSKHPAEKFGCTSCHGGQGSGTSFNDASHSPNSVKSRKEWTHDRSWEFNHMWDFPMLPTRFVESSCLKCHHEVTDLISRDNRVEAPKLLRGHNLIKENGCFGCHEISGYKSGQRIGPDLRVEPTPPLDDLVEYPKELDRVLNDPDNRPGNLRKVGPSLARLSEKVTDNKWIEKWLASPSAFRPDTKMPHYYGNSTNSREFLKKNAPEQEKFPDTEMASIAYFLTRTSKEYLAKADAQRQKDTKDTDAKSKDKTLIEMLLNKGRLDEKDQAEYNQAKERIKLRKEAPLVDLTPKGYKADKENADKGRVLFIERGCLSCHTHQGTETKSGKIPAIASDALFGPNLTQVAEKFANKVDGRKWLIQWILNPQMHSPRSRMPVTHLKPEEAADIATWLLEQPGRDKDDPWNTLTVEAPSKDELKNLARVYLTRMLPKKDMDKFLDGKLEAGEWKIIQNDLTKDEQALKDKVDDENELKYYLGKKAVTRLGCFGCHDIPGFESVKSIGVGLNDWGKKPADRLAFEDIANFYNAHYHTVDSLVDKDTGKPHGMKDGKEPYEAFYTEALVGHHHQREGYLNQKIRDPRSYDYNRIRAWDDRARMPKFTFARPRKKADEADSDFKARLFKEEGEAREAVATFVLGLTAEQVPAKSINQPTGDRLAEVKGRQVLDKYNCAGCHTIRPGVYDFKLGDKTLETLTIIQGREWKEMTTKGESIYWNHHNWIGRNPLGQDRLTLFGVQPALDDDEGLKITLSEALRYVDPKTKEVRNVPAGVQLPIAISDLSSHREIKTQAAFDQAFQASAQHGGAFADLLTAWLIKKDESLYKSTIVATAGDVRIKDSADARASLPPVLIGQGERTQSAWLVQFLRDPHAVRPMALLRMPKFNMSEAEAQALADYFAAVTRQNNPGVGLPKGQEVFPARSDLASSYWREKTRDYIERLKKPNKEGKNLYDGRLAEYKKVWAKIRAEEEPRLKSAIDAKTKAMTAASEAADKEKDADKKKTLEQEAAALKEERANLEKTLGNLTEQKQQAQWETQEAYAADGFRLLSSRELCTKCHQVGSATSSQKSPQGPPLDLAVERLRPDWAERWINKPQRFVPYTSVMPPYFNRLASEEKYYELFAGTPDEQMRALRDVLLNYPRISELPINRMRP